MSQELEGTLTNEINLVGTFGTTGGGTTNYNDLINKPSINNVTLQGNKTGSQLGLVSSTDLATVATSGSYNDLTNKPTIPAAQVNADWNSTSGVSEILNKPTLATVATSGSYDDLTNKPTIPAAQVNADWNSSSGVSEILNKPTLATVATSGSYNDLSNTPTIPVNSDFALSGLSDTDITTPSANQVLAYDSNGKVVNTDISNIPISYNDLSNKPNIQEPLAKGSSIADADNLFTTGIYRNNNGISNCPYNWGVLLVFSANVSALPTVQFFITSGNDTYTRMNWGAGTWTSWAKLTKT